MKKARTQEEEKKVDITESGWGINFTIYSNIFLT